MQVAAIAVVLVFANYAALMLWRSFASTTAYTVAGEVKVRTLSSPREEFARKCAEGGVPVVLRNSVATLWQARNWSPAYLETRLKRRISGIYENDNRWFGPYFDSLKPLANASARVNAYRTDLELPGEELMSAIQNATTTTGAGRFLYFTGGIEQLGEWALDEIQPVRELLVLNPRRASINAWIGQPRVVAHCHYDGYHNFYAQLYGTKKFTLFRPTNWPGLYPYPFLHPSHAQAQVNVSDASDAARHFPLIGRVEAVEVTLGPGDLLYMPPLWFHHVEALSVSISVNVWTDSGQTEVMERVHALPLPTSGVRWPTAHTSAMAASLLLFSLLEAVCHVRRCPTPAEDGFFSPGGPAPGERDRRLHFVHRLWDARYRTLMERGQLPSSFSPSSKEEEEEGGGRRRRGILCEGADSTSEEMETMQEVLSAMAEIDFKEYTREVARLVKKLPQDTWELWVGNYLEFVVAQAVPVHYVGLFLRHFRTCIDLVLRK